MLLAVCWALVLFWFAENRVANSGYSTKKIEENINAEIFQVCWDQAQELYPDNSHELKSETLDDMRDNIKRIMQWLEADLNNRQKRAAAGGSSNAGSSAGSNSNSAAAASKRGSAADSKSNEDDAVDDDDDGDDEEMVLGDD